MFLLVPQQTPHVEAMGSIVAMLKSVFLLVLKCILFADIIFLQNETSDGSLSAVRYPSS